MPLLVLTPTAIARAAEPVDLLLVLASDVSRSVDHAKFQLQREGYAAAISDPRVLEAINSGPHQPHRDLLRRMVGRRRAEARDRLDPDRRRRQRRANSATSLLELPRSFADRTSISGGIDFAMAQLERAPFEGARRTIDVSGDGTNNSGRDVRLARDEAVAKGVTINGLVILSERPMPWNPEHTNPPGGLANYYQDNVIGGPGAFVMVAENFNSFGQAIIKKLIAEIADAAAARPGAACVR